MFSLIEVQRAFAQALRDRTRVPLALANDRDAERFAIYRGAFAHNIRNALAAVYPAVCNLVGEQFFAQLSDRFVRAAPSTSGDLHAFGERLAEFVAGEPALASLPYLADVARLEWALHTAFHALDDAPLGIDAFARIAPDALAACTLRLRASARLLASRYPIARIWEINQSDAPADAMVDLDAGGECALVIRRNGITVVEPLDAADYAMLSALHAGTALGVALESVHARFAYFDLGAFLSRHVPRGTFSAIDPA